MAAINRRRISLILGVHRNDSTIVLFLIRKESFVATSISGDLVRTLN